MAGMNAMDCSIPSSSGTAKWLGLISSGDKLMKKTKILAFLMAATMLASCSKAPEEAEKIRKERETTTTTTTEETTEATPTPEPTPNQ